jgi:hypothetical protein
MGDCDQRLIVGHRLQSFLNRGHCARSYFTASLPRIASNDVFTIDPSSKILAISAANICPCATFPLPTMRLSNTWFYRGSQPG